jgi:beta-lactamase regulating signal transducer with metallopeptidase domain
MTAWLTDTLLYTGLLIALVLLVRRPLGRLFGPQFAYALWALPALRLILPPIELPASLAPQQAQLSDQTLLALAMAAEASPAPAPGPTPLWENADLWLTLWLNGAVLFLAWRIASYLLMRRELLAEARTVGEAPGSRSGAGRPIRLVETPAVSSPVAFGVFDKVVALPQLFMAMEDRAARDLAIAHELAHHRGHDLIANFAAQPLLALHWFNPLAWLGWRAMRRDQEAACDARVLAGRGREERAAYAGLIAGFAAGPRLALAAPMACPMVAGLWGEKSIIHRLRSLSMTDVSPTRRRLGRLLLAGGALMLPLTASFSYAASAQDSDVEPIPVAPSAAPAAPVPPVPANAPEASGPDPAPQAVPAPRPTPRIQRFQLRRDDSADPGPGEHRTFVMRVDGPMSKEQRKQFEKMRREWEKKGAEWRAHADEWRQLGEQRRQFALAHMPEVSTDCDKAGADGARSWTDDSGRQHVVICQRMIRDHARMAQGQATMGLRLARDAIANNPAIGESVRNEVLGDLDREISRLEAERK